jgi:hypothetical protein
MGLKGPLSILSFNSDKEKFPLKYIKTISHSNPISPFSFLGKHYRASCGATTK